MTAIVQNSSFLTVIIRFIFCPPIFPIFPTSLFNTKFGFLFCTLILEIKVFFLNPRKISGSANPVGGQEEKKIRVCRT
jgi:hypothetical protein